MKFNAFTDPWVPVVALDNSSTVVSLRTLLTEGNKYRTLDASLSPLDREALTRFLGSLMGAVLRDVDDEALDAIDERQSITPEVLDTFESRYASLFEVFSHERPFLQRWDVPHSVRRDKADEALAAKTTPGWFKPLVSLHPHVPGGSSSRWAQRRDNRDPAADTRVLVLLLVTNWWMSLRGNGRGFDNNGVENGNPDQAGTRPLSAHWQGPTLYETMMAGVEASWVGGDTLPMWLDQTFQPDPFRLAANSHDLWRVTYARNMVSLFLDAEDRPVGCDINATSYPVPRLASTDKEALKAMHEGDYARLFVRKNPKSETDQTVVQLNTPNARLSSTEGFVRWYELHANTALRTWATGRLLDPRRDPDTLHQWHISLFCEITDGKGSREYAQWIDLPYRPYAIAATSSEGLTMTLINQALTEMRKHLYSAYQLASEGRTYKRNGDLPGFDAVKARYLANVEGPLQAATASLAASQTVDAKAVAEQFRQIGIDALRDTTRALTSPALLPQVSQGRQAYEASTRVWLNKTYKQAAATPATGTHS